MQPNVERHKSDVNYGQTPRRLLGKLVQCSSNAGSLIGSHRKFGSGPTSDEKGNIICENGQPPLWNEPSMNAADITGKHFVFQRIVKYLEKVSRTIRVDNRKNDMFAGKHIKLRLNLKSGCPLPRVIWAATEEKCYCRNIEETECCTLKNWAKLQTWVETFFREMMQYIILIILHFAIVFRNCSRWDVDLYSGKDCKILKKREKLDFSSFHFQ